MNIFSHFLFLVLASFLNLIVSQPWQPSDSPLGLEAAPELAADLCLPWRIPHWCRCVDKDNKTEHQWKYLCMYLMTSAKVCRYQFQIVEYIFPKKPYTEFFEEYVKLGWGLG